MEIVYSPLDIHFLHPSREYWITFRLYPTIEVYGFLHYLVWQSILPNWQYGYLIKYKGQYITYETTFVDLGVTSNDALELEFITPSNPNHFIQPLNSRPTFGGKGIELYFSEILEMIKKLNHQYTGAITKS